MSWTTMSARTRDCVSPLRCVLTRSDRTAVTVKMATKGTRPQDSVNITVPVDPGQGTPVAWMRSVWTHLVVIPVFVGQDSGESMAPVKIWMSVLR